MKNKDRLLYFGVAGASIFSALVSGILAFAGQPNFALAFLAIAVMLLPVVSHLRMRRMLSSLRAQQRNGSVVSADRAISDSISSLNTQVNRLSNEVQTRLTKLEEEVENNLKAPQFDKAANEVRRESRMIRLIAERLSSNLN